MQVVSKDMKMTCGYLSVQEIVKYLVTFHHFPGSNRNAKNQNPAALGGDKNHRNTKTKIG